MRSNLIWESSHNPGVCVLIEAEPLEKMCIYRQNHANKPESGGILLGYRRGPYLHVTMITEPQNTDQRFRCLFKRSADYHQQIALRQWKSSEMRMDYLGEWHTHPEKTPSPSSLDLEEWLKICSQRKKPMLFAIIGWNGEIWLGLSNGQKIGCCIPK